MKLLRLSGTFGRLDGEELVFSDGLNIFSLPNEAGKSTWCALLRAMLYGMDSRERNKIGFLADKNRYAPWSGKPMAGVLELEHTGRRLRLRRAPQKREPFALVAVEEMETDLPAPEFLLPNLGETLTGVSREVFERTIFIPQGQMAVTASGDLEQRIAALISGGEEDVSYSAAAERLKDWRNRRGRTGTGLISKLETRLQAVLDISEQQQRSLDELRRYEVALEPAAQRIAALEQETLAHKQQQNAVLSERRAQAKNALQQAEREVEFLAQRPPQSVPIDPLFDGMSGEEAWKLATADAETVGQLKQAALDEKKKRRDRKIHAFSCFASAIAGLFIAIILSSAFSYVLLGIAISSIIIGFSYLNKNRLVTDHADQIAALFARYDAASEQDMLYRATAYREELLAQSHAFAVYEQRLATARDTAQRFKVAYETLAAQSVEPEAGAETLPEPTGSPEETARQLAQAQTEQRRLLDGYHAAKGRLSANDPDELEAQFSDLCMQRLARSTEHDAIKIAEAALAAADETLRRRFSPAINKKAGEIFTALTVGAYSGLTLAADFTGQVLPNGDLLPRQDLSLSAGTLDQLYLAVRLAVCALTYEGELPPLVLDDALASFDDERSALALNYLANLGSQVLLFTCHSREAGLLP